MLTVIAGCMFSGKTERLISLCVAHYFAGHLVIAFKPSNDDRYSGNFITSHANSQWISVPINPNKPSDMALHIAEGDLPDVIAIDEAQFFDAQELIKVVETFVYKYRIPVIISGLSQDFEGKPFGAMPHLLAVADDIIHLKSVCAVTKKIGTATRTFRKSENKEQVAVGGSEMYEPRSFEAWLESRNM